MITIGSSCGGIGDNLIFTPIFHATPTKFQMLEHVKCRNVAKLIENICTIEFVEHPVSCPENTSKSFNIILKKLHGLNLDVSPIPKINLIKEDVEWAKNFLLKYQNPIIFVGDNNGNHDPNDIVAKYRVPKKDFLQNCINQLSEKYTVLHFGLSNRMTNFDNVIQIKDLEITKLSACYSIIGKYFGIDTGDYWLTIATGGKAEVVCPDSTPFYNHDEWHLKPEMWWAEPIRIRYTDFYLNSRYQNQIDSFIN
jgi:hypothetical protein